MEQTEHKMERKSKVSVGNIMSTAHAKSRSRVSLNAFKEGREKSMSRMRVRRQSYGFSGVPGIRPLERTSILGLEFKRPPLVYLPTYQLDSYAPFDTAKVRLVINELLDKFFTGQHKYNIQESPALVLRLASEIVRTCKSMAFNRYRVISVVTLGQKRAQSYNNAITFLWDHERDNYVDVQREVTTAFIQTDKSLSRMKIRKQSYGFSGVPGIRPMDRISTIGIDLKRPPLVYLPTYQLNSYAPFDTTKVRLAVNELLDECFTRHYKYNIQESPALVLRLASDIVRTCKSMAFNRYRVISVVTLGQKRAQSYNNAITFLWDHERDNYVDVQREVTTAFIQVTVFGIYLD